MLKYLPCLLLVLAVGCSKPDGAADPDSTGDATSQSDLQLPDATATVVKFTCPGMT